MLTGLKVSPLSSKYLLKRSEHNAKWESIPTNRAQKVDEKNETFVKLLCLLPELWSLKCSKWPIFTQTRFTQTKAFHVLSWLIFVSRVFITMHVTSWSLWDRKGAHFNAEGF